LLCFRQRFKDDAMAGGESVQFPLAGLAAAKITILLDMARIEEAAVGARWSLRLSAFSPAAQFVSSSESAGL
jgi:hypothetical protein